MTKVLWLINPLQVAESDLDFPKYIQQLTGCNILCVFLEDQVFDSLPMYSGDPMFPSVDFSVMKNLVTEENMQNIEAQKQLFSEMCNKVGLKISIHNDIGDPIGDVVLESRFADMILVKSSLSFNLSGDEIPSEFVKKVLNKAECPVLVMPDDHQTFEEIYFAYNGGYSSVFAIRQFTYLFPQLKDIPVTVLYVDEDASTAPIVHEKEIKELLNAHYSNVTYKILRGDVETELLVALMSKKNAVVTYGAFGRSNISRLFRRASAKMVVEIIDIPLFITHP